MNATKQNGARFTGYEYKEITVPQTKASLYLDSYESFGWQEDEHFSIREGSNVVTLHLRRDRKILNKMELTRLQRNFEASMEEIDSLEQSIARNPLIIALTIGLLGTAFMAGATFAITATPPIVWLCVLLAIPGFIGWASPYFLYRKQLERRRELIYPLIEAKYDEIYELCKKGNELLN